MPAGNYYSSFSRSLLYALFLVSPSHQKISSPNFLSIFFSRLQDLYCHIEHKVSPSATVTVTVAEMCSVSSEIVGDDVLVNDCVEQEESSIMDSQKEESSKWTNEKHSLYLKSIEASFIDQLYNSLDMQTSQTQNTCSSNAISTWRNHVNTSIPSGQFKVLQRGCWSKKCFKREKSHLKDADRPRVSPGNPWIQHFTNGSLKRLSSTATATSTPTSLQSVPDSQLHQQTGCNNTEVTDQNFVEDTQCSRKRTRTSKTTHSSNDQVVPYCVSDATEIRGGYVCSKK